MAWSKDRLPSRSTAAACAGSPGASGDGGTSGSVTSPGRHSLLFRTQHMKPGPRTPSTVLFATVTASCLLAFSGSAQTPASPQAGAPQGAGGRGAGGFVQDNSAADFSSK